MTAADLAHPEWLPALAWIVAIAVATLLLGHAAARRRSRRLLGGSGLPLRAALRSDAMLTAALVAIALALLGPRIGERTVRVAATGVDVVFLVDVSQSMEATDVPPSRLHRARRIVSDLMARLSPGDRVALAAFADRGLLLTPLTPDTNALADLLSELASGMLRPAGSRLDRGVLAGIQAFESGSRRPRVLVVASDGEDPRGHAGNAAEEAQRAAVRIVTAAVGSEAGSVVPDGGRPLRLASGAPVTSRRDTARLADLAASTGGAAFVADEWGRIDGAAAVAEIRRDVGGGGEAIERRVAAIRVAPFAALALTLLLLEGLPRSRGRRGRRLVTLAVVLAFAPTSLSLLLGATAQGEATAEAADRSALLAAEARAASAPEDARAQLALGLAYLEHERGASAARAFRTASVYAAEPELAAVAYYDLGVAELRSGRREAAREAFFEALAIDPSDAEARFNLEWTLADIRRAAAPPAASSVRNAGGAPGDPSAPAEEREAPPERSRADGPQGDREGNGVLGAAERQRLLARVVDDSRRWLRAGSSDVTESGPRATEEPAW